MTTDRSSQNIPVLPDPLDTDQQRVNRTLIEAIKNLDRRLREQGNEFQKLLKVVDGHQKIIQS